MKYPVYSQIGEKVGETLLPKEIFGVKLNPDLVHQVIVAQMANQRQGTAHTKTRGEVRGGGKKPWRQKGTGRARHGSIRSPIWRGGGVVFGPRKDKDYSQKINKKMRRKALLMALSAKAKDGEMIVLEDLKIAQAKTKLAAKIIKNFAKGQTLLVLPEKEENIIRAFRNLPDFFIIEARNLNPLTILSNKYLLMPKDSIRKIKEVFA